MKQLLCSIFLLFFAFSINAQQFKGTIEDEDGKPIPGSTVYIHEISRGIAANDLGQFQTFLPQGSYTCEFRSLGYETQKQSLTMDGKDVSVTIRLRSKSFLLNELVVYPDGEDPAYRIMRRAIAYAPFYRNQVETYTNNTYTKGNFRIDKIPRIFKSLSKVNDQNVDINSLVGKTFVMESDNEITFTAPNRYSQRIKAAKSSIPKEFDMGGQIFRVITTNVYTLNVLSTGAFRYYTFKLEDVEYGNNRIVNKIRVTPRRKSGELYSGYIYILENTWNVYATDLSSTEMGSTMRQRTTFQEVQPSVYLPITHDMTAEINTMGVKGNGRYFASVTYHSVTVKSDKLPIFAADTALPTDDGGVGQPAEKRPPGEEKLWKQIEQLSEKEKLSTREAYRLSKMMQQVSESEEEKQNRQSLEIKEFEQVHIEADSLAFLADSVYWEKVRVLPLQPEERKSYAVADSINPPDSLRTLKNGPRTITVGTNLEPKSVFGKIVMGGGFGLGNGSWMRFGGLANALDGYSFVDGFTLGQRFTLHAKLDSNRYLSFKPAVHYATASKTVRWQADAVLHYSPMKQGFAYFSVGHVAADINGSFGMNRLLDGAASLIYANNHIRYYDRKFVSATNRIDLANGLNFAASANYEVRQPLHNATSYNFSGKTPRPNIPDEWLPDFPAHHIATFTLQFAYTPRHRYKVENGRKWYVSSAYPTITATYKKSADISSKHTMSTFDIASASIRQTLETSLFSSLNYSVTAGAFFNRKSLYVPDYKFFAQNPMALTDKSFNHSFNLLPHYAYSNLHWVETHVNYTSDFLLFKNLPFLQDALFDEALHVHFLHADNRFSHIEGGYSVGLGDVGRVGIFAASGGKKFNGVAVRVSLPLFSTLGK